MIIKDKNKDNNLKAQLTNEDGQTQKLEEKKVTKKGLSSTVFGKDVNDPSERGHD